METINCYNDNNEWWYGSKNYKNNDCISNNSHKNHDNNKNKLTMRMIKNDNVTILVKPHIRWFELSHDSMPSLDPSAKVHQSQAPRIRQWSDRGPQLNGLPPGSPNKHEMAWICMNSVADLATLEAIKAWHLAGLTTCTVSARAFFWQNRMTRRTAFWANPHRSRQLHRLHPLN